MTQKLYLKPDTKIKIRRVVLGVDNASQEFTCTVAEAIAGDWFDHCNHTVGVGASLDNTEYDNYNGCRVEVHGSKKLYVLKPGFVPREVIIWNGKLVSTTMDDDWRCVIDSTFE